MRCGRGLTPFIFVLIAAPQIRDEGHDKLLSPEVVARKAVAGGILVFGVGVVG